MTTGLKFDEFEIGKEYESPRRTVTEADIQQFAGLSGDDNSLHTDSIYIKEKTSYPSRIAHGALTFAMATGLSFQLGLTRGTNLGFLGADELRFLAPVVAGDTIHLVVKCIEKKESKEPGRGIVTLQQAVYNQNGVCVFTYISKLMIAR